MTKPCGGCVDVPCRGREICRYACIYDDDEIVRDDICEEGPSPEALVVQAFGYEFLLWTCHDCVWYGSAGGYTIVVDGAAGEVTVTDENGNTATFDIVGSWDPLCVNTFEDPDKTLGLEVLCVAPADPPECNFLVTGCRYGEACTEQTTRRWRLNILGISRACDVEWDEEAGGCAHTGEFTYDGDTWTVTWEPLSPALSVSNGVDSYSFILKGGSDPLEPFTFFPPSDACHLGYGCLYPYCDTPDPVFCGDNELPVYPDIEHSGITVTAGGSELEAVAVAIDFFTASAPHDLLATTAIFGTGGSQKCLVTAFADACTDYTVIEDPLIGPEFRTAQWQVGVSGPGSPQGANWKGGVNNLQLRVEVSAGNGTCESASLVDQRFSIGHYSAPTYTFDGSPLVYTFNQFIVLPTGWTGNSGTRTSTHTSTGTTITFPETVTIYP